MVKPPETNSEQKTVISVGAASAKKASGTAATNGQETKDSFWTENSTLNRNTVIHGEPPKKGFNTKSQPEPWANREDSSFNYTPFKKQPNQPAFQPQQPQRQRLNNNGRLTPQSLNGALEASEFTPALMRNGVYGAAQGPQLHQIRDGQPSPSAVGRRPASCFAPPGTRPYGQAGRRMSDGSLTFQPIESQSWAGSMVWSTATGEYAVPQQPPQGPGGQSMYARPIPIQIPHAQGPMVQIPRAQSRQSLDAAGNRTNAAAYIAATLPRRPPYQQLQVSLDTRPTEPPPRPPPQQQTPQQQTRPLSAEQLVFQEEFGPIPEEVFYRGMGNSEGTKSKASHPEPVFPREPSTPEKPSPQYGEKQKDVEPIFDEMRMKISRKSQDSSAVLEFINLPALEKLCILQIIFGCVLFGLGVARLLLFSVWGVGVEVVYGIFVIVSGIMGLIGVRKAHYCSIVACMTMCTLSCVLSVWPFITGLMVTVPETFKQVTDEQRKYFTSDSEPYGVDILLSVVCLVEVLVAAVISALGCRLAGRLMEKRFH